MKKLKKALSLSLALVLSLAMAVPASAANPITLSENNVTVTFSDVISYEDVRVCFPDVESDDPDTYYLYCTDIRIYHFPSTGIKTTMYNDRWDNSTSELNMVYEGYLLDPERMEPVFLNDDDEEPTMVRVPYPACTPLVQIVGEEEIYGQVNSKPVSKGELSEELPVNISTKLGKFIRLSVTADEILGPGIGGESAVLTIYCAFDDGKFSYKDNAVVTTTPTTPTQPEQPAKSETAMPTNDKLTVDGVAADPTVYKIDGSNFFKIRDVAALLNGTEKQFAVDYDNALNSVTATTGKGYAKLDTDLTGAPAGGNKDAAPSNDTIYVNGEKIDAQVYKIDGSNYFKLRDLGKALNFHVDWTREQGMIIDTSKPYSE